MAKGSFPFNVESPTHVLHRAQPTFTPEQVGNGEARRWFSTRCGYRVGSWSIDRWGKLIPVDKRDWTTSKLRVCRRCYP